MIHERIVQACDILGFIHLQETYDHYAEEASKESISYLEFLDKMLWAEDRVNLLLVEMKNYLSNVMRI